MQPNDTIPAAPPSVGKERFRLVAWTMFAFAFFLTPVAWNIFIPHPGLGGELGRSADVRTSGFLAVGVLLGAIGAMLLGSTSGKKIVYPMLAAVGIAVAFFISNFVIIRLTRDY